MKGPIRLFEDVSQIPVFGNMGRLNIYLLSTGTLPHIV